MSSPATPSFRLSVLDQAPIAEGSTAGHALRNSIELARLADRLGYERYWLAEHHGTPALACACPEVLIGPIAQVTERIRIGSGGVMLPHYSPLKVAESFSMLSGMYPNRIDLGIGRAAGTSPAIAFALQRDRRQRSPDDFHEQLDELLNYFSDPGIAGGPFPQIAKSLPAFTSPQPFLLGSSLQSAVWAAEMGLPYVFADFINADGAHIVDYYRQYFRPSRWLQAPHVLLACWVICAETSEEALELSSSGRMLMTLLYQGRLVPVPSVRNALRFLAEQGLSPSTLPPGRRLISGNPAQVKAALQSLAQEYGGPQEIAAVNILYDHRARMRSYELLAETFGLAAKRQPQMEAAIA